MTYGHQARAIASVQEMWTGGARSVLLVAPTGAGKTRMGATLASGFARTLWLTHRRELVSQASKAIAAEVGAERVGVIMAGVPPTPSAPYQVASIDTVLARPGRAQGMADGLVVLDEAHHFLADTYRALAEAEPTSRVLGLTATPQRSDGRPLGDIFQTMVVGAQYSELIASGVLVPVQVVRPKEYLGRHIAADPTDLIPHWTRRGERVFAFFSRVSECRVAVEALGLRGVSAVSIEAGTAKGWRDDAIELFGLGTVSVLANVYALTEGVDVPVASVAVSTRSFDFEGAMLQAFGRVLRRAEGKTIATIVDLTGATHRHGLPTDDREYSLEGAPIRQATKKGDEARADRAPPEHRQDVIDADLEVVATPGAPASEDALAVVRDERWRRSLSPNRLRDVARRMGIRAAADVARMHAGRE